MAGNSQRRGAIRKAGTKKGPTVGSGGQRRRGLEGRGATPPAHMRPNHPAAKRAKAQSRRPAKRKEDDVETVLGRNPVAGMPARRCSGDRALRRSRSPGRRATQRIRHAGSRFRHRDPGGAAHRSGSDDHQRFTPGHRAAGAAVRLPASRRVARSRRWQSPPALLVALDNISDPRNLGAIVRSVAAFGGHGVLIPQRRSASVTAVAWRTSAGAAARIPIARATNLNRTLKDWADHGLQLVGLDADGDTVVDDLDASGPIVVVVGSEGKGLSRLVRQNCDAVVSIPMCGAGESLNASVAAGVVLAEIARQRRS